MAARFTFAVTTATWLRIFGTADLHECRCRPRSGSSLLYRIAVIGGRRCTHSVMGTPDANRINCLGLLLMGRPLLDLVNLNQVRYLDVSACESLFIDGAKRRSLQSRLDLASLMLRYILLFFSIIATPASAVAAQLELSPGQYVRNGDSGTLTIRSDGQKGRKFEIHSIGSNCHICGVSGVIEGNVGRADSWTPDRNDSRCVISFSAYRSKVVVEPTTHHECRAYCGARADFAGSYVLPPAACTDSGRQAQRDRALASYRSRHYSQGASTFQTLITQCGAFMNRGEIDQVRNDLALSHYHNGEISQCLATLNGTLAAEFKDEKSIRAGGPNIYLPPCDIDNYIGVAKATWFNKGLCTKAMKRER